MKGYGYSYGYATEADGEEIAALLENASLGGELTVAYCRRPNAVLSLAMDGEKSAFVVVKDAGGKIVGTGACVINGGVAYLTGMRAVKTADIPKCFQLLRAFCVQNDVRLTYTTILADNAVVRSMLEKKRPGSPDIPDYLRHSELVVNIIKKGLRIRDGNRLTQKDGFYVLQDPSGSELARGRALEQWDHKQYVVKGYGRKMTFAKRFLKWLPNENEVLKFFTLASVQAGSQEALESFLRHVSHLPLEGAFFLFGGERCPVKSIKYRSVVYIVDWDKTIGDASGIALEVEIASL